MANSICGRVALITGGASGIGRAAALKFAEYGAAVVIGDRSRDQGEELATLLRARGAEAEFVELDASNADSVDEMVSAAAARFGRIDFAVNNAGVADSGRILSETTQSDWDRVFSVNLEGVWLCMRAEIKHMLNAGGGAIVNMASRAGLRGIARTAIYAASKHGVIGLTKSAAIDYAARGIRINAVCPGLIRTPLVIDKFGERLEDLAKAANPLGRMGEPDEVAEAVVWLCSDAASFLVGVALPVDGGATAV